MENRKVVDQQRRRKVQQFVLQYEAQLARRGSVVPTWRLRAGRKVGPYFLLVCRDAAGRQRSVYLGPAGDLVDETRAVLLQLQAPLIERRQLDQVRKQLQIGLARARQQLDHELKQVGLWRKGSEIRGWSYTGGAALDPSRRELVNSVRATNRHETDL